MTRSLPRYDLEFTEQIQASLALVGRLEVSMLQARAAHIEGLKLADVELAYELAYLRMFLAWERFLETSLTRLICGYRCSHGSEPLKPNSFYFKKIADAEAAMLGGRDYLLWHDPNKVITRAAKWLLNSRYALILQSAQTELTYYAAIRHRIAHDQDDSKTKFDLASMALTARRYKGARPGRLLRDWQSGSNPPQRWLSVLGDNLASYASQICA